MNDLIKVDELPELDISEFLDSPETIAAYFNDVLAENDPALLAAALGDVARAHSMTEIARKTGMSRESLYKALRPNSSPRFETIHKVCHALGLKLHVVPIHEYEFNEAFPRNDAGASDGAVAGTNAQATSGEMANASGSVGADYGPTSQPAAVLKSMFTVSSGTAKSHAGLVARVGEAMRVNRVAEGLPASATSAVWHYGLPRIGLEIQTDDDKENSSLALSQRNKPLPHG